MKLTNYEIYKYAQQLTCWSSEAKMPVRIGFFLQKNVSILLAAAREIEEYKLQIGARFGQRNERNNGYYVPPELQPIAAQELQELFELTQELPIHIFQLSDFEGISLTYEQLSTIMFMIEE